MWRDTEDTDINTDYVGWVRTDTDADTQPEDEEREEDDDNAPAVYSVGERRERETGPQE